MITLEDYKTNAELTLENIITATEADAACIIITKNGRSLVMAKPNNMSGAVGLLEASEQLKHKIMSEAMSQLVDKLLNKDCQCPACTANREQLRPQDNATTVH